MGRGFSFAISFSLVKMPAQYSIQLTHSFLFPGNKAFGNEAKNPESSTGCLFYRVPKHRSYNGQMQTIYAIKLPCMTLRQEGHSLVHDDTTRGTLFGA
jgi:hypothetical protein